MPTKPTPAPGPAERLIARLTQPEAVAYFGRAFALKVEVLANLEAGNRTLADIGREHHVSRQAVHALAVKARKAFGPSISV